MDAATHVGWVSFSGGAMGDTGARGHTADDFADAVRLSCVTLRAGEINGDIPVILDVKIS